MWNTCASMPCQELRGSEQHAAFCRMECAAEGQHLYILTCLYMTMLRCYEKKKITDYRFMWSSMFK